MSRASFASRLPEPPGLVMFRVTAADAMRPICGSPATTVGCAASNAGVRLPGERRWRGVGVWGAANSEVAAIQGGGQGRG